MAPRYLEPSTAWKSGKTLRKTMKKRLKTIENILKPCEMEGKRVKTAPGCSSATPAPVSTPRARLPSCGPEASAVVVVGGACTVVVFFLRSWHETTLQSTENISKSS